MISIITPTLNNFKGLEETFLSLKNIENLILKEWIIVDSNSTDQTNDFVKEIKNSSKIKFDISYFNIEQSGPYGAMNYGINSAREKYIWIINSGDSILNFSIIEFKNIIDKKNQNQLPVIFGKVIRFDKEKKLIIGDKNFSKNSKFRLNEIHPSVLIPKVLYDKYGLYNKKYKLAADLDLLLRLKSSNVNFVHMDNLYVSFPYGGISSKKFESLLNMLKIIISKKLSLKGCLYLLLRYFYSRLKNFK